MAQIECKDLSLGYEGATVSEGISFRVNAGDYLCIVGENGSGKTTLMKTLLRQKEPLGGSISYSDGLSALEIGYLPQQSQISRDFPATVYEAVLSGCIASIKNRPFYTKSEKKRAEENIEKLGLSSLKNKPFGTLSGGQRQRVLLARALCATRKMLLLDEPVSGLDPVISAELYSLLEKLNREDGISIVMISHDIHAAMRYASHILHLGKTPLFFGSKEDYIHSGISGCFCSHDHEHHGGNEK